MKRGVSIGLALLALALLTGCENAAEPPPEDAAPVRFEPEAERVSVRRVAADRIEARIAASGSVEARRVTSVSAEVPGRLEEVRVDVGDEVAAGDVLFRIDASPFEMALREAEAGLALAQAEEANAEAELGRAAQLAERNVVSDQRSDQLRTQAQVARARTAQIRARLARARHDLERTEVRAPYDASVVERLADEGSLAGSEPVVVLQESGALEAVLDVPEATPVPVRRGDGASLWIEGLQDPVDCAVGRVSRRVDPKTRTYQVRCDVENPEGRVKAGSYVRADLRVMRSGPVPVVERSSLLIRDGRAYVFVVEGDVARLRAVRAGVVTEAVAEVLSGLAVGESVVTGSVVTRLPDGARVQLEEGVAAAAPVIEGGGS